MQKPAVRSLYDGLKTRGSKQNALEEFLVGLGVKERIKLSVVDTAKTYQMPEQGFSDRVRIEKSTWGYVRIQAVSYTHVSIVLGGEVKEAVTAAVLTDRHVDARNSITLIYEGGQMAVLNSNMESFTDSRGVVNGTCLLYTSFQPFDVITGIDTIAVFFPLNRQQTVHFPVSQGVH